MRDYSKIASTFWTGTTGRALRGDPDTQVVGIYLMTAPHATMVGVFTCPVLYIAHETGLAQPTVERALVRLEELGFCTVDRDRDLIWVREMARLQIGETLSPGDKRCKNVATQFAKIPPGAIRDGFAARYGAAFHLPTEGASKGHGKDHAKGHPTPGDAPPKRSAEPAMPLRSQEQEQEQNPSDLKVGQTASDQTPLPLGIQALLDQPGPSRIVATALPSEPGSPARVTVDPSSAERDLFARARVVAGTSFGGQVPKLIKAKGGNVALARAAVETASTKHNPREYLSRIIRGDDTGMPPGQLYDRGL